MIALSVNEKHKFVHLLCICLFTCASANLLDIYRRVTILTFMLTTHISAQCFFYCSVRLFPGLMESIRVADRNNWALKPDQLCDLASSLNTFLIQNGLLTSQSMEPSNPPVRLPMRASDSQGQQCEHRCCRRSG